MNQPVPGNVAVASASRAYRARRRQDQRDELILENLDYVRHILGKLVGGLPAGVDVENLESAGILGLVEAAGQYDDTRDTAFRTFAYPRIRGAILDELRRNSPLPQKVLQRISLVRRAMETLPPPATPAQLANKTGLSVDEVDQALEALRLSRMQSFDEVAGVSGLLDRRAGRPDQPLEKQELSGLLADAIEQLPETERLVVTLYYLEDLRLKEIGEVIDRSESRVSRLLARAEFLLAQFIRSRGG